MTERLYFDSVKEKHDTFFIEYRPPMPNFPFATLNVCYVVPVETDEVISNLEQQARLWVDRYPVPVMASAFDRFDDLIDLIDLKGTKESNYLIVIKNDGRYENHWNQLPNDEFPEEVLDIKFLLSVYTDIGYRTQGEVTAATYEGANPMQRLKALLIIWAVVIPALIAILEFFSPTWVAAIALAYSLWKAYQQWLLMIGLKKKSEKEIAKEDEELRMRHHHHHCEQNPDAFARMKIENFKRDAKDRVRNEFDSLSKSN